MKQKGVANIFVIILGVFIIIILFGYFRNNKIIVNKPNGQKNQTVVDSSKYTTPLIQPYTSCGIQINAPAPLSYVDKIFEFSGQVTGCGWNQQNGFIGTLDILDSNNYSITDTINVPVAPDGNFKITVGLKRPATGNLGLVYFKSVDGLQVASFTIYLK